MVDLTGNMPIIPDLIQILIDPPKQELKLELTIEQKIRSNFYKCDTEIQWIRADNAKCLDKHPTYTQRRTRTPQNTLGNTYQAGQCVWHVKNLKPSIPNGWGSAYSWLSNARASGWTVSSTPIAGAVGIAGNHAVYVVSVHGSTVTISEMNYNWTPYAVRTIDRPISYFTYIY